MNASSRNARIAGGWYLSLVLAAPFSQVYIPTRMIVRGDAAATALNVLSHQALFRLGILAGLLTSVLFICVGLALYRLLREVNPARARMMLGFVLVSGAVGFVNHLNYLAALDLYRSDLFAAIGTPQREALAMLFQRLHGHGMHIDEIFWGLWLLPFGLLVIESRFLPRLLGFWLIVNGVAYLALSMIAITTPAYYSFAFRAATPLLLGEVAIVLWLLTKGARPAPALAHP